MMEMEEARRKSSLRTLHVLLVVTFVVSGYFLLSYLILGLTLPVMGEPMAEMVDKFPDEFAIAMERVLAIPQWYFLVSALLNAASVAGAIMMWKLRKNGFHCYTLSKLLLMLMPMLFLDRSYVGIGDMMLAVLVIVYYFVLLRLLGVFGGKNDVTDGNSDDNANIGEESSPEDGQN